MVLFVLFLCLFRIFAAQEGGRAGATFNHQGPSAPAARWEKHGEILIIAPRIACVWFGSLVLVVWFWFLVLGFWSCFF